VIAGQFENHLHLEMEEGAVHRRLSIVGWTAGLACLAMSSPCAAAEKKEISLRLYVAESTICASTARIPLELEVWNFGTDPIEIDTKAVGDSFGATALYNTESNTPRIETLLVVGDQMLPPARQSVVIQPGAAYIVRRNVLLSRTFFFASGFYEIQASFAHKPAGISASSSKSKRKAEWVYVKSNRVILNVEPCGQKPPQDNP
jgi:hypothetical protein